MGHQLRRIAELAYVETVVGIAKVEAVLGVEIASSSASGSGATRAADAERGFLLSGGSIALRRQPRQTPLRGLRG